MKGRTILGELFHKEDGQDITSGTSKILFLLRIVLDATHL